MIRSAAEKNYPPAQYWMSLSLKRKNPASQKSANDEVESVKWLLLSAKGGYKNAQYLFARMLSQGTPYVTRDDVEAARWYHLAADQGHRESQFALGNAL